MTRRRRVVLVAVVIAAVALAGLAASRLGTAGSESSPYRLPWQAGQVHTVVQGAVVTDPINGTCTSGCVTHNEQGMRYSWDFDLAEGTEVLAARGGTVAFMNGNWSPDHCGGLVPVADPPPGYLVSPAIGNQANFVLIDHGDGTSALYLHLSQVSPAIEAKAKAKGPVVQGEVLGLSGKTGFTQCRPHLHFQVQNSAAADWATASVPISFADDDVVARAPGGVPVEGEAYLSANGPAATGDQS